MTEGIPVVRMYTDVSGHTRFARMQVPVESKTGLGSVGMFSSLFVNQNIYDNTGDLKTQFALTPVPDNLKGEGPKLAHTAPRRQLVLTLSGCLEFKSCDVDEEDAEHKVTITGFHELPHVARTFQILSKQDVSASDGHFVLRVFLINITTLELQATAQG